MAKGKRYKPKQNRTFRVGKSSAEELLHPGPKPVRTGSHKAPKQRKKVRISKAIPPSLWTPIVADAKGRKARRKAKITKVARPAKQGSTARQIEGGPSVSSLPPPPPSPYAQREREKREAYLAWLREREAGAQAVPDEAAMPALTSAESVPETGAIAQMEAALPPPAGIAEVPVLSEPGQAAYNVVPYRERVSLRHLADGDMPVVRPVAPAPQGRRSKPAPTSTTVKAKNVGAIVVAVTADRRMLMRMSPVQREAFFRDQEALRIGARREVRCGYGWCDLLSNQEIVEVKAGKQWCHALGQVLSYGTFWPDRRRRIHLFEMDRTHLEECVRICTAFDVTVSVAEC